MSEREIPEDPERPDDAEAATADDGPQTDDEKVEEASEDSYPASDPPAW